MNKFVAENQGRERSARWSQSARKVHAKYTYSTHAVVSLPPSLPLVFSSFELVANDGRIWPTYCFLHPLNTLSMQLCLYTIWGSERERRPHNKCILSLPSIRMSVAEEWGTRFEHLVFYRGFKHNRWMQTKNAFWKNSDKLFHLRTTVHDTTKNVQGPTRKCGEESDELD